jgi:aryl carrier-like protein
MTMTLTLDQLRSDIAEMLEDETTPFGDDDNLLDVGLDSMRAMNLILKWDEAGVPLDFADLAEAPTVAGLWALLRERQEGAAS